MELFVWDERYLTGEAQVDHEHRGLVELINRIVILQTQRHSDAEQTAILDELVQYAVTHFAHEEVSMLAAGCDPRHAQAHIAVHKAFARQVGQMRGSHLEQGGLSALLRFLSSWLAYHILGMDHAMARQMAHIREGMSPAQAYELEQQHQADPATASLLKAMHTLYSVVVQRSEELLAFNEQLENTVQARTADLTEANSRLEMRNQELLAMNSKLAEMRQQLLQAEKLAAVGQLAAGVAHEINNPISFVQSNIHTLDDYLQDLLNVLDGNAGATVDVEVLRNDIPALVRESQEGISRVRKIVEDLREFSQVDNARLWHWHNLRNSLDATLHLLADELSGKLEIVREDGELPDVWCSGTQINQVFVALLSNAAEAVAPAGGVIHIRSGVAETEVWLEIADNGRGIAPEVLPKIFDPFFTTKPIGAGIGMGLAQAYGIIRQHKGRIEVSSEAGKGSRFRVWLPIKQD